MLKETMKNLEHIALRKSNKILLGSLVKSNQFWIKNWLKKK